MITQDEAKQLRPTNYMTSKEWGGIHPIDGIEITEDGFEIKVKGYVHKFEPGKYFDLAFIPLSEDLLLRLGFEKNPNFAIGNPLNLSLGRNRTLIVGSVGTPNEMVFIREENKLNGVADEPDLVVVRNYDYDGKTYLHHIQNIASDFGQELTLK